MLLWLLSLLLLLNLLWLYLSLLFNLVLNVRVWVLRMLHVLNLLLRYLDILSLRHLLNLGLGLLDLNLGLLCLNLGVLGRKGNIVSLIDRCLND